jgi:hypothetical protein
MIAAARSRPAKSERRDSAGDVFDMCVSYAIVGSIMVGRSSSQRYSFRQTMAAMAKLMASLTTTQEAGIRGMCR